MTDGVILPEISLSEIAQRIEGVKSILIISHTGPDGDTVGSAASLAYIADALGAEVKCVTPDPMADRLAFLMPERFRMEYTEGCEDKFDLVCSAHFPMFRQRSTL